MDFINFQAILFAKVYNMILHLLFNNNGFNFYCILIIIWVDVACLFEISIKHRCNLLEVDIFRKHYN